MRRAALALLVAAVVLVAGWSSIVALSTPSTGTLPATAERAGAPAAEASRHTDHPPLGVLVEGGAVLPVVLVTGAPVSRAVLERADVVVLTGLVLVASAVLLAGAERTWRRARGVARPGPEPMLLVAPRRGPPMLPARLPTS